MKFGSSNQNILTKNKRSKISHMESKNNSSLSNETPENYNHLKKLENLMIKIFISKTLRQNDLNLSSLEMSLIKAIFKKKRMPWSNLMPFDIPTLLKISSVNLSKKKEDQLKFVVKKCIKQMQSDFKRQLEKSDANFLTNFPDYKKNKDLYFYEHFFKVHAEAEQIPIEKFFHFRTGGYRYTLDIPNSVTKKSVELWKKNPEFIQRMVHYIENFFKPEFEKFNIKKIRMLISNWEGIIERTGIIKGTENILKAIRSKGCKLPWSVAEVDCAITNTLNLLR
jgi:hypothetical protein